MNFISPKQQKWRTVAPCITDFTYENFTDWPLTSCKWGPIVQDTKEYFKQKIYFSFKTDGHYDESNNTWKHMPSQLVVATVDLAHQGYWINNQVSFIYQQLQFYKNPNIKIKSMIVHPGEATIIKANQSKKLIATKNDQSGVYVWDPNKHKTIQAKDGCHAAQSDIQLIGHQQLPSQGCNGLDWFGEQKICSGGRDQRILIWDIGDYQTKLSTSTLFQNKRELNNIVGQDNLRLDRRQSIQAQHELIDAQFNKFNQEQILGISFDQIAGWDLRQDQKVFEILKHKDITSGEWSQYDENQIAYGTQDGQLFIYDLRNQQEIQIREGHRTSINCIRFGPDKNHITIGSDELYSINIINKKITFCYYGHKGSINDFEINERSPWTYVSTCFENHNEISGGGQLHIYRLMDLIYLQS